MRLATRSFISRADLLVKVIAAMRRAGMRPDEIRCAIFSTMTRVLPLPAPASTSRGPSVCSTAARWGGLRKCMRTTGVGRAFYRRRHVAFADPYAIAASRPNEAPRPHGCACLTRIHIAANRDDSLTWRPKIRAGRKRREEPNDRLGLVAKRLHADELPGG